MVGRVKEDVNKVTISGVAGVLGSTLANFFLERGIDVHGIDIQRINEAWRLKGVREKTRIYLEVFVGYRKRRY